jgi:hypothetical protein
LRRNLLRAPPGCSAGFQSCEGHFDGTAFANGMPMEQALNKHGEVDCEKESPAGMPRLPKAGRLPGIKILNDEQ